MRSMLAPDELRRRLAKKWGNHCGRWLLGEGEWPLSFSTEPPTEVQVLENWNGFDTWLMRWRGVQHDAVGVVSYELRNWQRVGEQSIPCAWRFDSPDFVAELLGEAVRWRRAKERVNTLIAWLPAVHPRSPHWRTQLSRHFELLADTGDDDFVRLCNVVDWLWHSPSTGLYPRQLPIPGIDSKWVERHKRIVALWLKALRGEGLEGDFYAATGLRKPPDRLRMRLLDEKLRLQLGGLSDVEAPVEHFVELRLQAKHVLIVENLYTCLSMGDLPGTVLIMGRGNAIDAFARLHWLNDLPITYWGDLDTDGLAILNRLRSYFPRAQSILMDAETLHEFKSLWVEGNVHPAQELSNLTEVEQRLYQELRRDKHGLRVRLEQERIDWRWAWGRLIAANPA